MEEKIEIIRKECKGCGCCVMCRGDIAFDELQDITDRELDCSLDTLEDK